VADIKYIKIFFVLFFLGCSFPTKTIVLSPHSHLNAIHLNESFTELKKKYSVSYQIDFGPDPDQHRLSLKLAKEGVNYVPPIRKIQFRATVWDLPLIKAYLKSQRIRSRSAVGEELRGTLLEDHKRYTQILLAVDSHVHPYFQWGEWTIWLEDQFGRSYFPQKTKESSEEDLILPEEKEIFGKETRSPGHKIHRSYGTLFFKKLDLPTLSPLRLILMDQDERRRVELSFRVKGNPPPIEVTPQNEERQKQEVQASTAPLREIDSIETMRLHFEQATTYFKNKQYGEAIREWQKVLDIDSTHQLSRSKIKKANQILEEMEVERQAYTTKQQKRKMQIHFLMATEHFQAKEYVEAIQEWEKVLEIAPDHELSQEKIRKAQHALHDY